MTYDMRYLQVGRKRFTTASGSVYLIDFDAMTLYRVPGEGANKLRQDEEVLKLVEVITFEPDVLGEFLLEGLGELPYTYRRTTAIESVEDLS